MQASFSMGRIRAAVTPAHGGTAVVTIRVRPLTERQWQRALGAAARARGTAWRLLGGSPGAELERAWDTAGVRLFPEPGPAPRCTCRSRRLCRHVPLAVAHVAALLDANPFLWLEVLGRDRAAVLTAMRACVMADAGSDGECAGAPNGAKLVTSLDPAGRVPAARLDPAGSDPAAGPSAVRHPTLAQFLAANADLDPGHEPSGQPPAPDALLRQLGPLPPDCGAGPVVSLSDKSVVRGGRLWHCWAREHQTVEEVLLDYARQIGGAAADLARGRRLPRYRTDPLPGRPIPLSSRRLPARQN